MLRTRSMLAAKTKLPLNVIERVQDQLGEDGRVARTQRGAWSRWYLPQTTQPLGISREALLAQLCEKVRMTETDAVRAERPDRPWSSQSPTASLTVPHFKINMCPHLGGRTRA
jgi:hypothetical protein